MQHASAKSVSSSISNSGINRRAHKRIRVDLAGRFMREDRQEFDCRLIDISVGGALVVTEAEVSPSERVIVNFPDLGNLHGPVYRTTETGFVMTIDTTPRRREKLAAQLTWLINRDLFSEHDARRNGHHRVKVDRVDRDVTLPDGTVVRAQVIDISISGVSLESELRPEIGAVVGIGRLTARVVRHHERGFAAEFQQVQPAPELRVGGLAGGL